MNDIAASSTAMNTVAASSTAMNTVAASSTAMNAITSSYTAINAMTTLTAYNAIKTLTLTTPVKTLISNINSGSMALASTTTGSSTTIGLNGLLTLLSVDNGSAVTPGNSTASYSSNTLAQKLDSAFSSLYHPGAGGHGTTLLHTLSTNEIAFMVKVYLSAGVNETKDAGTSSSEYNNIINYIDATHTHFPNGTVSPLRLSGDLYIYTATSSYTLYGYYLSYTPS